MMNDEYYCLVCDHPANEHTDDGVCHVFEIPSVGIFNSCICDGVSRG
ncbi:hypothetical protein SEA_KYKAR_72 [Mycobacterium phage Kykar]|nr:hypothetical protein SEA_KYKAR_72 [Mycobacterium phage Kykar]